MDKRPPENLFNSQGRVGGSSLHPVSSTSSVNKYGGKRVDPLAYSHRFSDKASIYTYLKQQLVSTTADPTLTISFATATLPAP